MKTASSNTNSIRSQLFESFQRKEARDLFVSQHLGTNIAAQIYALRENRGWTQTELAGEVGMAQGRISLLEEPNYQRYSIETLKRLASAFDVALIVRFVPFSELADWAATVSPERLAVPEFQNDSLPVSTEDSRSDTDALPQNVIPLGDYEEFASSAKGQAQVKLQAGRLSDRRSEKSELVHKIRMARAG